MAKQSLAAQAGAIEFALPAVFGAGQAPAIVGRKWPPYITFAHNKRADEYSKILGAYGRVSEGSMYYIHNDQVVKLDVAKLGWFIGTQYWIHKEDKVNGQVLGASWTEMPWPYKEMVEACVLVYLEDRVMPANIRFRTTKCPAAKALSDEHAACQEAKWAEKSGAHKESFALNQPFMRFYGEVTEGAVRTSKKSGNPYTPLETALKPTGPAEWRLLSAFQKDAEAQQELQKVADAYQRAVDKVAEEVNKKR